MVTVLVLVFLNFVSLFIIYRARSAREEETTQSLQVAAVSISRAVQNSYPIPLAEPTIVELRRQHNLRSLYLLPSRPQQQTTAARRQWFGTVAKRIPAGQMVDLASKLIEADFTTLTKGADDEYYYLYPVPAGAGQSLLVISRNVPELAWLDEAGETILIVGLASLGLMMVTMLFLYKAIIAPFYAMRAQAAEAGRLDTDLDADEVVEDYRRIIHDLQSSQERLEELNREISRRADSLEQFNSYLMRAVDSGVVTLSLDGFVQTMNSAAGRLLEIEPKGAAGRRYDNIFSANQTLVMSIQAALAQLPSSGYAEYDCPRKHFGAVVIGVTISAIRDHQGNRIGLSVLMNDVSEVVELRRQLEERKRLAALGEMAGGLAHQLRNAMGVIAGYGNLVKKRLQHAGEPLDTIHSLMQETNEAEALVKQFLDFSRPCELQETTVSLRSIIDEVIETFRVRSDCSDMTFRVEQNCLDLSLAIDVLLFKQALKNLIDNAVTAYDRGYGTVVIRSSLTSDGVSIDVIDNGRGIDEENIEKIFTPFFSSRASGTGLGLPLARKMIELHGGSLVLRTTSPRGTIFSITLPITCCVPAGSEPATASPAGL